MNSGGRRIGRRLVAALLAVLLVPLSALVISGEISRRSIDGVEAATAQLVAQSGETLEQTQRSVAALVNFNTKAQVLGVAEAIDLAMALSPELTADPTKLADEVEVFKLVRTTVVGRAGFVCIADLATKRILLHKEVDAATLRDVPGLENAIEKTELAASLSRERASAMHARGLAGWRRSFTYEDPSDGGRYWVLVPLKKDSLLVAGMTTRAGLADSVEMDVAKTVQTAKRYLGEVQARTAAVHATFRATLVLAVVLGGIVVLGGLVYVRRRFLRPIGDLTATALAVQRGDLHVRSHVESKDEFELLSRAVNDMLERITAQLEELERFSAELEHRVIERTEELRRAQAQVLHSEKLAVVGTLTAGIMHEINNPVNFVSGATFTLGREVERLLGLLEEQLDPADWQTEEGRALRGGLDKIGESARLIAQGSDRISSIVTSLRAFARAQDRRAVVDLREGLESTLVLAKPLVKERIVVHREYGDLPAIECNPGEVNQVFMNLVVNAAQAIPDKGEIWIRTALLGDRVMVEIADSGPGVPDALRSRIFDPFFTTKEVGQGTGMGLSICAQIVQAHGGKLEVGDRPGGGASFRVILPVSAPGPSTGQHRIAPA